MPDIDEYRISELDPVLNLGQDDLMEVSVEDDNAESGYVSHKSPLSQLGAFFVNILQYVTSLKTGNKTVTGAINQTISNFANDYDSTSTYAVDDCVIYGGVLYKCNTAIPTAEEWNATHWTQIKAVDVGGGGGGGTSNYNALTNKPQINSVELSGNKSLDDLGIQPSEISKTASGSIASFTDGGDDIPVSEFECDIVAQQASGTPTPTSPLPITGFSQADIPVSGLNIFDEEMEVGTLDNSTGETEIDANKMRSVNFIPVKPNTTYGVYNNTGVNLYIYSYGSDKSFIGFDNTGMVTGSTFTTDSDTHYIKFRTQNNPTYSNNISINYPSTDTQYHAYKGNLYTVAFGQTIYGGRLIYKNGEWAIEATHGYVDLGSLDWSYTSGTNSRMSAPLSGGKIIANSDFFNGMCSIYKTTSLNGIYLHTIDKTIGYSGTSVWVYDTDYTDATAFTNSVSGQLLVYELETPTIIPITSATRVKTISGVNNIFSNTGDNSVKYFTNKADEIAELVETEIASTSADYHEYSTEEKIVGKWIDGRTVYEKTLNVGTIGSGTTFAHGITNLDWIIDYSMFGLYAGQNKLVSPANGSSSSIGFVISGWNSTNITFTKGNLSSNFSDCYCTIRYIKSTSNTRSLNLSKGVEEKPIEEKTEEIKTEEVKEEEK